MHSLKKGSKIASKAFAMYVSQGFITVDMFKNLFSLLKQKNRNRNGKYSFMHLQCESKMNGYIYIRVLWTVHGDLQ
jgi:hypothetical protein